jgi:putative SOS response-associated peptidase YedK
MTRGSLSKDIIELEQRFQIHFSDSSTHEYAPSNQVEVSKWHLVITSEKPDQLQLFQWGFILFWMEGTSIANRIINAGLETVFDKPNLFEAIEKRRCLIPFDAFYEHKYDGTRNKEFKITTKDQDIFCVAGVWDRFIAPDGDDLPTFIPLTHEANSAILPFNKRMPFILQPGYESWWLGSNTPIEQIIELIEPFPAELLEVNQIS